jgi:hypothetical protein
MGTDRRTLTSISASTTQDGLPEHSMKAMERNCYFDLPHLYMVNTVDQGEKAALWGALMQ